MVKEGRKGVKSIMGRISVFFSIGIFTGILSDQKNVDDGLTGRTIECNDRSPLCYAASHQSTR